MKMLKNLGLALIASCAALGLGIAPVAQAADVIGSTKGQENILFYQVVDSGAYSNSTVTPSDVTGLTVTIPATKVPISRQFIRACVYAAASKATSTTGTLTVNVSGSDIAASARSIASAAGAGTITTCHVVPRATEAAVIVKMRGVSADAAAFTVTAGAQFHVEVVYKNP